MDFAQTPVDSHESQDYNPNMRTEIKRNLRAISFEVPPHDCAMRKKPFSVGKTGCQSFLIFIVSCTLLVFNDPRRMLAADLIGIEKLEALQKKVPNMLARPSLKVGQWIDTEIQSKVLPKNSTPTDLEKIMSQVMDRKTKGRKEIATITEKQVTLSVGGEKQVVAREHLFSANNWKQAFGWVGSTFERNVKRMEVKDAKFQGTEALEVGGKNLNCGKFYIDAEVVMSGGTGEDRVTTAHLTYWYHDSIPIEGLAKSVMECSMDNRGEKIRWATTQTYVNWGD